MRFGQFPLVLAAMIVGAPAPAHLAAQLVRYEVSVAASSALLFPL